MKILAIGDFHGKFPVKLRKLAKDVDLVVSVGDYCPFSNRDLFFKHCYHGDKELWEIIGKRGVKSGILKDLEAGKKTMKILNEIGVPVISVVGNIDYSREHDTYDEDQATFKRTWKWEMQDFFSPMIKKFKNIHRFDYGCAKIDNVAFIGAYGNSFPGRVKSESFKKHRGILEKLFKKFGKDDVIFVSHNVPYDCRLDEVRSREAPVEARGRHYGAKLVRRIIDKYQPILAIGGHFHENQGKCKIGRTLVVNPGEAGKGKCAIIDFNEKKGRIKSIKFVK